jgi:hypothetical protein
MNLSKPLSGETSHVSPERSSALPVLRQGHAPLQADRGLSPVVNGADQGEPTVALPVALCAQAAGRAVPVEPRWTMVVSGRVVLKA